MPELKQDAERLRLGIRAGWLPVSAAIAWADGLIAQSESVPEPILDLSLAGSRPSEEVTAILASIPGTADPIEAMRAALRDLLSMLEREPSAGRQVAQWLLNSRQNGDLPEEQFGWEPWALDDEYELAAQGLWPVKQADERLMEFLRQESRA